MVRLKLGIKKSLTFLVAFIWAPVLLLGYQQAAFAACAANTANLGSASGSFSVPTAATYRVWSRIQPNPTIAANNSYTLEVDGSTCNVTVGYATIPANTWSWVDYSGGNTASKINLSLSSGTHTYALFGREAGLRLDRIIFSADTSCVPTGDGSNCAALTAPLDTTKPVVTINSPTNGSTVASTINLSATATDNIAVTKVEIYLDNALKTTASASSATYALNTTTISNGAHIISAKGYDAAGNIGTSNAATVNVSNGTPADTIAPTGVAISAPANNATVTGSNLSITTTASDNVGVKKVEFYMNNNLLGTDTAQPYNFIILDTKTYPNGKYTLISKAYDAANNSTTSAAVAITISNVVSDTILPTVTLTPIFTTGSVVSGTIGLTANASDNYGVTKVEFYVDGSLKSTATKLPYGYSLDSKALSNAAHSLQVKAYDAANNIGVSPVSTVTINNKTTTPPSTIKGDINGDGHVNSADYLILAAHYHQKVPKNTLGDLNGDGQVNRADYYIFIANYGK